MKKAGILGGGQLGRMLLQAAANYPVETYVMENDPNCPAAHLCHHFTLGDIKDFDQVYRFGKQLDCITIEIENVNVDALEKLAAEGVRVIPEPAVLRTIQNKITQKQFYTHHSIPTPAYFLTQNIHDVNQHLDFLPAVHKLGSGGYDGRGVQMINNAEEITLAFDAPSVLEKKINITKELALSVAVDTRGNMVLYEPVDMVFDNKLNLLVYQLSPATLEEEVLWKAEAICVKLVNAFNSAGLFAVELLVDENLDVWVNETAPRVHNSGHHTIEACYSSQFDMLIRILLDLPLGNTQHIQKAALINLIGAEGFTGEAVYEGLDEVLKMDNTFVHIYGKKLTKPGRKMGHITVISPDTSDLLYKANKIRNKIIVKADI